MNRRLRIGSLFQYVAYLAQKYVLDLSRNLLVLGVWGNAICCMLGFYGAIYCLLSEPIALLYVLPFTLLSGFGAWAMYKAAVAAETAVENMNPVLPPTRHNIERLPAHEMLLRGSEAPTEGQEKVLLRPASASEEAKPEELLRPHL